MEQTTVSRVRCGSRVSAIPGHALCIFLALAAAGCGVQPASTLGLNVPDDPDMPPPGGTDPDPEPQPDGVSPDDAPPDGDVPDNVYCEAVAEWDQAWTEFENEVLALVNEQRAAGADCGDAGSFGPAEPLTMNAALRCAARSHSTDMGTRGYFDHYSPKGVGPGERMQEAGYAASTWGENIAWGYASPAEAVSGWMASPGHCANIMHAQFSETGVGYYQGALWTQTFGHP